MAKTKFEVYKDKGGAFRWRLLAQNGEPVASSGEGFTERRTVMNAVKKLKDWANTEVVIDLDKVKEEAKKAKEAAAKNKAVKKAPSKSPVKKAVKSATKTVKKATENMVSKAESIVKTVL